MPIFGAAYAAPNKGTTILYGFRRLSMVLCPIEIVEFKERFSSTFKDKFNFQGLFNSSTFQACTNPVYASSKASDEPTHLCSLTTAFAACTLNKGM